MFKLRIFFALLMAMLIISSAAIAGDKPSDQKSMGTSSQMAPTGPPEQMKMLTDFEGNWSVNEQWKINPNDTMWESYEGVAIYKWILNGYAMQFSMESEMMGKQYEGMGWIAYDRETGKWQTAWLDDISGAIVYYLGDYQDGRFTFTGENQWNGQKFLSRISIYNITPQKFDWSYDMSTDGGKTWAETGKAVYVKRME